MRIRCHLFGCQDGPDYFDICRRCGRAGGCGNTAGDHDYLPPCLSWRAALWLAALLLSIPERLARSRCRHCGERLPLRRARRYCTDWCSPECFDKWIPF